MRAWPRWPGDVELPADEVAQIADYLLGQQNGKPHEATVALLAGDAAPGMGRDRARKWPGAPVEARPREASPAAAEDPRPPGSRAPAPRRPRRGTRPVGHRA